MADDLTDQSSSGEEGEPVETLVSGRAKRSTAGGRMSALLDAEGDDDLALLFEEIDDDNEFDDDAEGEGAEEDDMAMDSSSDEDDQGPNTRADDLEGEQQIKKDERVEKQKRRAKDDVKFKIARKKVKIDPTAVSEAPPPRPKKKSERISWIPTVEEGPTRSSSRRQTMQNKEKTHARLKDSEEKRVKLLANMERAAKRKAHLKPKEMTQEERLTEAERVEKKNSKSLNRWEEMEKRKAEERKAKIEALQNRRLEGPVMSYWSGLATWADGRLIRIGKVDITSKPEKDDHNRKKGKKEKDEKNMAEKKSAENAATAPGQAPPLEGSLENPKAPVPPAEGETAKPSQDAPDGAASNAEGAQEPSSQANNNTNAEDKIPATSPKPAETSTETAPATNPTQASSTPAANDTTIDATNAEKGPEPSPSKAENEKSNEEADKMDVDEEPKDDIASAEAGEKPEEPKESKPQETSAADSENSQNPEHTPVSAPSENKTDDVPKETDSVQTTAEPTTAGPPNTGSANTEPANTEPAATEPAATEPAATEPTASEPTTTGPAPESSAAPQTDPSAGPDPNATSTQSHTEGDAAAPVDNEKQAPVMRIDEPTVKPEESEVPPPPKVIEQTGRNLTVLENFDDKTAHSRDFSIYFNAKKPPRLTKISSSLCVITSLPSRYKDPETSLPFANSYAYNQIREAVDQKYAWSSMLGCYVGPVGVAARGVPERFLGGPQAASKDHQKNKKHDAGDLEREPETAAAPEKHQQGDTGDTKASSGAGVPSTPVQPPSATTTTTTSTPVPAGKGDPMDVDK